MTSPARAQVGPRTAFHTRDNGVSARTQNTSRSSRPSPAMGRDVRQRPGTDASFTPVFHHHSRPTTTHVFHHQSSDYTHPMSPEVLAISLLIIGIATTILGACITPFNPIAGIATAAGGLLLTGIGALVLKIPNDE